MNSRKIYDKLLAGSRNVRFEDACRLAEGFGFRLDRTRGSHHIFRHPMGLMLNFQPDRHGQAKPYQLRQLLDLVEEHGLSLND